MPTPKLQPSRALIVAKSDNANIPTPNLLASGLGTTTSGINTQLIDSSANFIVTTSTGTQNRVNVGDIIYINGSPTLSFTITQVVNATTLLLNTSQSLGSLINYSIYQDSARTGFNNQGCVLYVGVGGNIKVTTSGNDILTFVNVQDGTFFPINVIKVWSETTATNIIALW